MLPRLSVWTVAAVLVILAYLPAPSNAATDLHQLFDDEWEYGLKENPLTATACGVHTYNDQLPSVSEEDSQRRLAKNREFLARLREISPGDLSAEDRVNYTVFERLLQDRVAEAEFKTYLMPITNRNGFHVSFPELADRMPMDTTEDYENYIARLQKFRHYAQQHAAIMRRGIEQGYVLPRIVLEGYQGAIDPHIVDDPTESLLYRPFEEFPEAVPAAERERLTEAGVSAITSSVVPAYREFGEFIREEYMPSTRESIGASELPRGKAYYEHRVRRYTTLDMAPREVHEIGHREVKRIRAEMQEIIDDVGFEGDFADFVEFLRTDERFYVDTPEQLMKEVALVLKKMDGQLPRLFKTLPRMPYGIKRIPDFIAPKTTTAYYHRPAGDGKRAGFYFVNCYDLRSRPLYEVEALSLHEAVPGHHLQIALMQELDDVPNFRRFSGFTAFVEGWALYSERLGMEAGFYQDPYSDFGRLTYEMWRALRLVVDPGLHYLGWTRQRAIDFMAANSALTIHNITTEVDRYISWPGQAVAYKTGELKIRELRAWAQETLGDSFDVREFHDVVLLSGAVPLDLLEANVRAWVSGEASN